MSNLSSSYRNLVHKYYLGGKTYIEKRQVHFLLEPFHVSELSDQGKLVIKTLIDNNLMYEEKYKNCNIQLPPSCELKCCCCMTRNYSSWKLVGITTEEECTILKCILPYLYCEKCFRKRFCYQEVVPFPCGYAVFPPSNYAQGQYKAIGSSVPSQAKPSSRPSSSHHTPPSSQPPPVITRNASLSRSIASIPTLSNRLSSSSTDQTKSSRISTISVSTRQVSPPSTHISQVHSANTSFVVRQSLSSINSSPRTSLDPKAEESSPPAEQTVRVAKPEQIEQIEQHEQHEQIEQHEQHEQTQQTHSLVNLSKEFAVTLQYRSNGFFHHWYQSFFVINTTSIIKYPNESRNEKKRKEIFLYDAEFKHSIIHSDNKRPYCVVVTPGDYSQGMKPFVLNLVSQENEETFLKELELYASIARQNPPTYTAVQDTDSDYTLLVS